MNTTEIQTKSTTANERFHASGGADSSDTEQVTASFVLVRALPMPPPAAKPPPRWAQAVGYTTKCGNNIRLKENNNLAQKSVFLNKNHYLCEPKK